jgi:hypothetical protein
LGRRLKTWEPRWELLSLAAILLLAMALRVARPTLTEFKFSEARLEALALELTREGHLPLVGVPSSAGFDHSPISVYLYLPPFLLTTNPIPATIYGGLVGVAAVALCWWLARRWPGGGVQAAWIAALLFAVSPWSVAFSRKIWQVVFVPLLALAFIGLLISALVEEPTGGSGRDRRWHLAWALIVYALLVQVHPSAIGLAPALALWLLIFWRKVRPGPLLAGIALAALTGVPFLVHQIENGWPVLGALKALPPATWDLLALHLAWEAITGQGISALAGGAYSLLKGVPQLAWGFSLVGWLTVVSALWLVWRMIGTWRATERQRRQQARVDLVLLSWLAMPLLLNLRHSLELHLHFFALVVPAAYLIVSRAVQDMLRFRWVSRLRVPGVVGLGLLATAQVIALVLMGQFVATHDTAGGFGVPLGRYLAVADQTLTAANAHGAAEVLVVGQGDFPVVDETPAIFDVLLRGRAAYRFVDGPSTALFPAYPTLVLLTPKGGQAADWYHLLSKPALELEGGYQLIEMDGSAPMAGFELIEGPRLFDNGVELQGYAWEGAAVRRETGHFWLLWQVLWRSADDVHFFVQFLDAKGQQWDQRDVAGYPTAYRQKGDRVASAFDINVQPNAFSGPYWARIGLYLYPQLVNVSVTDSAGNPAGDTVLVGPWGGEP